MPLVRYFTGDLVRVSTDACELRASRLDGGVPRARGRRHRAGRRVGERLRPARRGYEFAAELGTRVFFIVVQQRRLHLLIEVADPEQARGCAAERRLAAHPVAARGRVSAPQRRARPQRAVPRAEDLQAESDQRLARQERKTITIMEALLEWPHYDARTVFHIVRRQIRNGLRRRRFLREDQR